MGAVSPLLAIKEKMAEQGMTPGFIWIGTKKGVEREIIAKENILYYSIQTAKWRRYFSLKTLLAPFQFVVGLCQAWKIIKRFQPDLILSAGGFVSVPVIIAAKFLKKKTVVHQQDIVAGLANKIMSRFATMITVTFESSLQDFSKEKTVQTGNPYRSQILKGNEESAIKRFKLEPGVPTCLIFGGSLGAAWINRSIAAMVPSLTAFCQIIHVVGRGKVQSGLEEYSRYHQYEYLFEELADAYAIADLVVARAGLSTLTELTALRKPTILIPIPDNQQEKNAEYFVQKQAAVRINQKTTTPEELGDLIKKLLDSPERLAQLSVNIKEMMPRDAAEKYLDLIKKLVV